MTVPLPPAERLPHRPKGGGGSASGRRTLRGTLGGRRVRACLDLAGEPRVEQCEVVNETIESVRCRWCDVMGHVSKAALVDRPGASS